MLRLKGIVWPKLVATIIIVETNLVSILGTLLLTAITTKPRFVRFLPMLTIVKCSSQFLSVQPDGSARGN